MSAQSGGSNRKADPRKLAKLKMVTKAGTDGGLSPEPLKLVIEAIVNDSDAKWCSACKGPAPVGVSISGVDPAGGRFLFCHPCADRVGGQSGRLSALVNDQLAEGMHHDDTQ